MPEKAKSSAKKQATAVDKPALKKIVVKKPTTAAVKKVKPESADQSTATAKKRSTAAPRKKEKITAEHQTISDVSMPRDAVEVAAYLNWCGRRNQGLPDDAFADWISAELVTGLAN